MKSYISIIAIIMAALLTGCGKSEKFSIRGEITGIGSQTVTVTYYANGGLQRLSAPAEAGAFRLQGISAQPTLASVTLSDGTPIATLVVKNGDKIKLRANIDDPLALDVSGSSPSSKIAEWMRDNAPALHTRDAEAINRSIAEFVTANPHNIAATAILVTEFRTEGYEQLADSLFTLISPAVRPTAVVQNFNTILASQLSNATRADLAPMNLYGRGDSMVRYNPRNQSVSMLYFISDRRAARDSVIPRIRHLTSLYPHRRFRPVEISTAPDSAAWTRSIQPDSATWSQTWAPGSVAFTAVQKLAVPRLPFFIVADSTGSQLYRGSSVSQAEAVITDRLK